MKNIDFVIKIGAKEIIALCVGVPLMYRKLRDIKLKYDKKEGKIYNTDAHKDSFKFNDVIIDSDGNVWRRDGSSYE